MSFTIFNLLARGLAQYMCVCVCVCARVCVHINKIIFVVVFVGIEIMFLSLNILYFIKSKDLIYI